jgi:hypothetical protein
MKTMKPIVPFLVVVASEICNFVEKNFHGNIIVTTQPIEWKPPAKAKRFVLQPLNEQAIEQFVVTRQWQLLEHSSVRESHFEERCKAYLAKALAADQPEETLYANKRALSNPMDLTIVAQLLSEDKEPDLFNLQQQQCQVMADEYQRTRVGTEFPLEDFSEAVYQMRLTDQTAIPEDTFTDELRCMEQYKMVVLRHSTDRLGKTTARWYFRHDKIMEFFIVQTFLKDAGRSLEHLADPRFRGVYFLLATLLPYEAAMNLREELLQHSIKTKDQTVLAPFVELLNSRKQTE